jgi:hypothetical protein
MTGFQSKRKMGLSKMGDEIRWGLSRANNWKLVLCILPKNCFLTGKKLWGKRCYKGTRIITGPGDPVIEEYYIEKFEFMKWQLTRT